MAAVNVTFPGNLAQVKTAADLRSVPSTLLPLGALFLVNGLEGLFEYDPGSLAADDGKDVLRPVDKAPGQFGRWIRNVDGLATGPEGPTGPANSTYTSLAALKAAPQSNRSYILADGTNSPVTYAYVAGDFTGRADDVNVVKLDAVPLTTGALVRQQADSLAYRLPTIAAQTQSQAQKNAQTIDLWDFLTDAMKADVNAGDLKVDCSPAFNEAIAFAYGARPPGEPTGDATGGTTLYVKGGRYRLDSTIKCTYRRDNQIVDDGDLRRLNIVGDGTLNTALFYFGPASQPALEIAGYRGTTVNDGVKLRQTVSGIWLRRAPIGAKTGTGIRVSHAEGMTFEDVIVDGFETCVFATDVLEFFAHQLQMKDCAIGARFQLSDFTNPNVVRLDWCAVSGATLYGLHLIRPANFVINSLRMEGNGFDSNFIGILAELGTPEGGFSLGIYDSYLENNMGLATLTLAHGHAADAMIDFQRNTVHNDGATRHMQHHIDYARFGAAEAAGNNCVINHGPQRYRNLGAYVSSPSRSAVRIQTPGALLVEHAGNKYPSDNERPETNGFPTVGLMYDVMGASVFADGSYTADFAINPNVLKVEHPSIGVYRVFYRTAPRLPGAVIATATLASSNGSATIFDRTATYVQVQTYAPNGDPADRAFTLAVKGSFA